MKILIKPIISKVGVSSDSGVIETWSALNSLTLDDHHWAMSQCNQNQFNIAVLSVSIGAPWCSVTSLHHDLNLGQVWKIGTSRKISRHKKLEMQIMGNYKKIL